MKVEFQVSANLSVKEIIEKYETFTFPNIRKKALNIKLQDPILTVFATRDTTLVGMAVAEFNKQNPTAEVVSLFVDLKFRKLGIGTQLLGMLEKVLGEAGYKYASMNLWSNWNSFEIGKKLLKRMAWSPFTEIMIIVKATIDTTEGIDWDMETKVSMEKYKIILWQEINDEKKKQLQHENELHTVFPAYLSPFVNIQKIEDCCSLGILDEEKIAGWNICYRSAPDTVEYNNLFIRGKNRTLGLAQLVIVRSIELQRANKIPKIIGVFDVENKPVYSWYEKKMGKYLTESIKLFKSFKKL